MTRSRTLAPIAAALAALGVAALPLLSPQAARAQGYTFYTFDAPGADDTFALGISDSGQIVGGYDFTTDNGAFIQSGFSVNAASVAAPSFSGSDFTTYGVGQTSELDGISNSGQIVGDYIDGSTGNDTGFLLSGTGHTDFSIPGEDISPGGINDSGVGLHHRQHRRQSGLPAVGVGRVHLLQ